MDKHRCKQTWIEKQAKSNLKLLLFSFYSKIVLPLYRDFKKVIFVVSFECVCRYTNAFIGID